MATTVKDSFNSAFLNKISANKRVVEKNESDSDSAEEFEEKERQKRDRKRQRSGRNGLKQKRKKSDFKISVAPKKISVTANDFPEIAAIESKFSVISEDTTECIEAETDFFQTKNRDKVIGTSHMRPWDFPWLRTFITNAPVDTFDINTMNNIEQMRANLPAISRQHEEKYLCEPTGKQRACLMGTSCEGTMIDNERAFILREYLFPDAEEEYIRTGKYTHDVNLCLLCMRNETCRAYFSIRGNGQSLREDAILQYYRNIVDVKGQYCLRDTVCSSKHTYEGLIAPVVLHSLSAYKLVVKDGVRFYDQWRMGYPDFGGAPGL
jgi:hypothetical protein